MNEIILISAAIILITLIIATGRFFYLLEVKLVAKKLIKNLKINPLNQNYSLEQIVYFHSLPSTIPFINNAKKENISIKHDYDSLLFQQLNGIEINIKGKHETILLAYLSTKDFRFPSLDLLMKEGKIDAISYVKIATYRLAHSDTLNEIVDEVYKHIQIGRYNTSG